MYEKLSSYYDLFVDESLIQDYVKQIKHYKPEGRVLDLGTGTGPLAIELAKENYHVTATDISTNMLEMAYNNAIIENQNVHFYLHNILDTVNSDYDIITMSTDVINYINDLVEVDKVLSNIALAMNPHSIFLFDSLRPQYVQKIHGHSEDILLSDGVMNWRVDHTSNKNQIKHTVTINHHKETHLQTAYGFKTLQPILNKHKIHIIKKIKYEERILFICKKDK